MAFIVLKHINVYPKGEQLPGAILQREDFPQGTNVEGLVKKGFLRPDDEESLPVSDEDAAGWKERAEKLQTRIDEMVAAEPDHETVAKAEANERELKRVQGVVDALRTKVASLETSETALKHEVVTLKKRITDLGGTVDGSAPKEDKPKPAAKATPAKAENATKEDKPKPAETGEKAEKKEEPAT